MRGVTPEGVLRGSRQRPLSRPVPASQAAGLRRHGPRLAGTRRAERPRRLAEDRRAGGQGGPPGRARGARRSLPPAPTLPADPVARTRPVARLHRLRVHPGPHPARGDPRGRDRRPRGNRGGGADLRGARTRAREGDRAPGREAVERPARRVREHRRPPARLRPGADGGVRHADRARRHPGHARLHRARSGCTAAPRRRRPTSGGSACCSGRRSSASTRSGAATLSRPRGGSSSERRRSSRSARTCRGTCSRRSRARCSSNPQRRPSAERLAQELRSLPKRRRKKGGSKPTARVAPAQRRRRGARAARRPRRRRRRLGRDPDPVLPRPLADRRSPPPAPALGFAAPRAGLAVRARRGVLPARQHLARPGRRLCGARRPAGRR